MTIKVSHLDALKENKKLGKELWQLQKKQKEILARRRVLKQVIDHNEEGGQHWIVELPVGALPERSREGKHVNWKKLAMEMFALYKIPMSTELMCHKLWFHFPEVGFDRRTVTQNVSAALSNLEGKDQKLFRTRYNDKKGYIYGLKHFFGFDGKLKPYYYQQWKREEGEEESMLKVESEANSAG